MGTPISVGQVCQFMLSSLGSCGLMRNSQSFRVQGLGCMMLGLQGSGFRVRGGGFRVQGSAFGVQSSGIGVWGLQASSLWRFKI